MKEAFDSPREPDTPFAVTERYEVRSKLGHGGMGIVYGAFDRERRTEVAVKVLPRMEPAAMYRFKQEFRTLTDLTHPNLVVLHELIATGHHWFFTMELVDGVDLVQWLCGPEDAEIAPVQSGATQKDSAVGPKANRAPIGHSVTLPEGMAPLAEREPPTEVNPADSDALSPARTMRGPTRANVPRLREALRQLASAVTAIHEAGKLHLDLKPSNVMVRRDGRVVVLDFGLARDLRTDGQGSADEGLVVGTPSYMAPEQALGEALTPAADWYAVGAILFRVLTGQLLVANHYREPNAPAEFVDVPADLNDLCMALLRRSPGARAGAQEIFRVVGSDRIIDTSASPPTPAWGQKALFVGREGQLTSLREAFDATRAGQPVAVYLGGRSGMGKTALANEFVSELRRSGEALVLAGRCYERESVPFKALDSVMDALASHLRGLPRAAAAGLLPRGIHDLGRLFPALLQVEALSDVPQRTFDVSDDRERRRRAFIALKELLSSLVDTGPLVLFIDDLQWGDVDSARLLVELLGPPDPPALLLLGTYRTEEESSSALLGELFRPNAGDVRKVPVPALSELEARDLACALLGDEAAGDRRAATVAAESEGSPFFVVELVRHLNVPTSSKTGHSAMSLEDVLRGRFERLSTDAQRLLELISVAGGPLEQGVAGRAADLAGDPMLALAELRVGHLVRTRGTREVDEVETYHDRIRETVARRVDSKRLLVHHLHLALELEATGRADPEVLSSHFLAVGRKEEAGKYALAAAEQAALALAFDKAATLYRHAIDLGAAGESRRRELFTKLGTALVQAGRGRDAALSFLAAAEGATSDDAIALRHSAAEQFLISGHVDEGMGLLRDVLKAVDLPLPGTSNGALAVLLARRARLAVRGLKFQARQAGAIPKEVLRQIDICFSAALGLSVVDTIYGASFQALQLLLALSAGEPSRIALGLAFEAGHVGCSGGPTRRRTLELVEAAEALAKKLENPEVDGFTRLMKGVAEWGVGRFRTGLEYTTEAEGILRERCTGVSWQIDTAQVFSMICMTSLGNLVELSQRHPAWLKEARDRGDLYATTTLRTFWGSNTLLALARHEPDRARADLDDAMSNWSRQGYHPQHYYALLSHTLLDLYTGQGAAAHQRITEGWTKLSRSLLLRVQGLAITAYHARASAALAAAESSRDRGSLLRAAEKDAATLMKTKVAWSEPLAHSLEAGIAVLRGDKARARERLERAVAGFDASHMALHGASARWMLGALVGRGAGDAIAAKATEIFESQKIRRADRFSAMLVPGFMSPGVFDE
jgi:eukaryotic-like serine/threonine-protein kinase